MQCSKCTDVNNASYKNHVQCVKRLMSEGQRFQLTAGLDRVSLGCLEYLIEQGLDVSGWDIVQALKMNQVSKFYLLAEAYPESLDGVKYQLVSTAIYNEHITILKYLMEDCKLDIGTTNSLSLFFTLAIKGRGVYLHLLEYLDSKGVTTSFEHAVLTVCQEQHKPSLQAKLECLDHMVRLRCIVEVTPLALRKLAEIMPDPLSYPHIRRLIMAAPRMDAIERWKTMAQQMLREVQEVILEATGLPVDVVKHEVMSFM